MWEGKKNKKKNLGCEKKKEKKKDKIRVVLKSHVWRVHDELTPYFLFLFFSAADTLPSPPPQKQVKKIINQENINLHIPL